MTRFRKIVLRLVIIMMSTSVMAQDISGDWYGIRNYPQLDLDLRITLHIEKDSSGFLATFDNPDRARFNFPFDSISFVDNTLFLSYEAIDLSYLGVVDLAAQKITGFYEDLWNQMLLTLGRDSLPAQPGGHPYLMERYDKQEVYIPMRDSVNLFTSIYTPKNKSVTYPILIKRSPYNVEPFEEKFYSLMMGIDHLVEEG